MKKVLMMFVMSFILLFTCSYAMTNEEAIEIFKNSDVIPSSRWNSDEVKYFIYRYSFSNQDRDIFVLCFLDTSMPVNYTSSTSPLLSSIIISQEKFNEASWYINSDFSKIRLFPEFSTSSQRISNYRYTLKSDSPNTVIDSGYYKDTSVPKCIFSLPSGVTDSSFIFFNDNCKIVTDIENCTTWDGESYYYQASTTPDTPSFEGLSDTQKATIINSVVNSDEFKNIVPEHYRNQFFIIKNEWTNRYKVYFYPKQYYLKGRVFEADETEAITQKSYKIIATDSENFLWGVWQSINPFDYYVFSGYFNEDYSFNSYFYEYKDSHEMNQEYFSYEDEPIVYSSKDIGFVIYDISTNETTEDTENSISSTILKDDDGNEIKIVIPTEEGTENITFWDSIVQKIVNGIKVIFVPDFSNSLEFLEKLKSKFNFLFEVKDLVSGMFDKLVYQTEPPTITVDLTTSNSKYNWGSNAIALDMSWYEPYKPTVDIFICAFCYGIFFWNLFRKLANIVSGVSGEGAQSSKEGSK